MDNNTINKTQRVRGSARIQPDGTFDFKPDGQGVKKIEEVRQARVHTGTVPLCTFFENSSLDFQRYGENFVPL
jgi:hypothetical protein